MNFLEHRNADPFNIPHTQSFVGHDKYVFPQTVSMGVWTTPMTSINPLEIGGYPNSPAQKYVDPRHVDDCAFPIKDEPSPFSPPLSNIGEPKLSISSIGNQTLFSDDVVSTGELSPIHPQYNYQLCETTCTPANSYTNLFHGAGVSTETDNIILSPLQLPTQLSPPIAEQLTPPPSPPTRRRGPGRPSKVNPANNLPPKRPTGHTAVKLRRQMHNDSAMRSRARLNQALEDLWKLVPQDERVSQPEIGEDQREVCRAVKVEVAIGYLRKLKAQLPSDEPDEQVLE